LYIPVLILKSSDRQTPCPFHHSTSRQQLEGRCVTLGGQLASSAAELRAQLAREAGELSARLDRHKAQLEGGFEAARQRMAAAHAAADDAAEQVGDCATGIRVDMHLGSHARAVPKKGSTYESKYPYSLSCIYHIHRS
jgi:hypothetical protein